MLLASEGSLFGLYVLVVCLKDERYGSYRLHTSFYKYDLNISKNYHFNAKISNKGLKELFCIVVLMVGSVGKGAFTLPLKSFVLLEIVLKSASTL